MKKTFLLLFSAVLLTSCSAIKVTADYDNKVDFKQFKTFAFYKPGIDKATISDLDKRRILRAIESELLAQGFSKSDNPDMLVSIFAKSREKVEVNQNNNFGYSYGRGWNPWMMGGRNNVSVSNYTEGTLFIDFIDKKEKKLIWQGIGTGALKLQNREKKEARINEFVKEIISRFPPEQGK